MFSGSAVLWRLTVILQVSEESQWTQSSAWFHKHTQVLGVFGFQDSTGWSLSLVPSHTLASVVVLLMYSTAQFVQIILANNFLFPVPDSATSCPLNHVDSAPKNTQLIRTSHSLKWMCNPTIHLRPCHLYIRNERKSAYELIVKIIITCNPKGEWPLSGPLLLYIRTPCHVLSLELQEQILRWLKPTKLDIPHIMTIFTSIHRWQVGFC